MSPPRSGMGLFNPQRALSDPADGPDRIEHRVGGEYLDGHPAQSGAHDGALAIAQATEGEGAHLLLDGGGVVGEWRERGQVGCCGDVGA